MNERIRTKLRLDKDHPGLNARVLVDIWMDQTQLSSMVVYSGYRSIAEGIVSGDLVFDGFPAIWFLTEKEISSIPPNCKSINLSYT